MLVTVGDRATEAAREATSRIPIVMAASADPVGSGFVESLARPGGTITGLSLQAEEAGGKRLQLLKQAAPRVVRVALLWNAASSGKAGEVRSTQVAAHSLGVVLQVVSVRGARDFDAAFIEILRGRTDALIALWDPLTHAHQGGIVDFAVRNRLPMISETADVAVAGGKIGIATVLSDLMCETASAADTLRLW